MVSGGVGEAEVGRRARRRSRSLGNLEDFRAHLGRVERGEVGGGGGREKKGDEGVEQQEEEDGVENAGKRERVSGWLKMVFRKK